MPEKFYIEGKLPGRDWERLEPGMPSKEIANTMLAAWIKIGKPGSEFRHMAADRFESTPVAEIEEF
jgi:hypothetical protein